METCEALERLDLTLNFIGDLTVGVTELAKWNPHLRELHLMGNPCSRYVWTIKKLISVLGRTVLTVNLDTHIRYDGYRDFVIAMLPDLDHLDGIDIEVGERIRAIQRLDELRPLIASQETEYRSGIARITLSPDRFYCYYSVLRRLGYYLNLGNIDSVPLILTARESQKAEIAREIAEGRSEYEKDGVEEDDNRRAFWASKSKHAPGESNFFFLVLYSNYIFVLILPYS